MSLKWLGALLVLCACGAFALKIAFAYKIEEKTLRQLITVLDFMKCELRYHLTPLPELCVQAAGEIDGVLSEAFISFSTELENQIKPDAYRCMLAALSKNYKLPAKTVSHLESLGRCLGRFDLDGQLNGLKAVYEGCQNSLEMLHNNRDFRVRGYQTLALCTGVALVILFI